MTSFIARSWLYNIFSILLKVCFVYSVKFFILREAQLNSNRKISDKQVFRACVCACHQEKTKREGEIDRERDGHIER